MTDINRMNDMITRYGELCNQQVASHILGVSYRTIARMLEDGRLKRVGIRVDVRSICEYIEDPYHIDRDTRYMKKYGTKPKYAIDFEGASRRVVCKNNRKGL